MSLLNTLLATLAAGPAPAPTQTADERKRHLALAEWHLREAVLKEAIGDEENAEYHREACREFLELVARRRYPASDAGTAWLRDMLQKELDA